MIKNLQEILQIRLDQYPDYASEPLNKELGSMTRDVMAKIVLKSEFHSLSACQQDVQKTVEKTLDSSVKVIADDKLVRAITKSSERDTAKVKRELVKMLVRKQRDLRRRRSSSQFYVLITCI